MCGQCCVIVFCVPATCGQNTFPTLCVVVWAFVWTDGHAFYCWTEQTKQQGNAFGACLLWVIPNMLCCLLTNHYYVVVFSYHSPKTCPKWKTNVWYSKWQWHRLSILSLSSTKHSQIIHACACLPQSIIVLCVTWLYLLCVCVRTWTVWTVRAGHGLAIISIDWCGLDDLDEPQTDSWMEQVSWHFGRLPTCVHPDI